MKSKIYRLGVLFIILVFCVGSCRKAGIWLVKKNETVHADAILILMGSISDRVLQAADLYMQKVAGKVLIVEASMGANRALEARGVHIINNSRQALDALVALGIPADSITILPGDASNTRMEAMIIREYLANKPGIDTLCLVSSSFHMLRASIIFKTAFKTSKEQIIILSNPSIYTNYNPERWWISKVGIQTVLVEYLKIANFILFDRTKLMEETIVR